MSQLVINRHPATIHYFTEDLGNAISIDMVLIPAGRFEMGSPEHELDRLDRESPQHQVTVPMFFMGRSPVTQRQWRQVAKLPKVKRKLESNPSYFKGGDRPVDSVSWNDAIEFCDRVSRHTKREYRLPSEAEWEYACRAGTTTPFHFGETIDAELANYNAQNKNYGKYGRGRFGEYRGQTTSVGMFPPNPFGLQDMHGNVWEWCQDSWHDSYEDAPIDGSAWEDKNFSYRLLRGGSWDRNPRDCRSAYRNFSYPAYRCYNFGFRVVCMLPRALE
jgi:formylglycine-generating enzyme required for sulfatase activity